MEDSHIKNGVPGATYRRFCTRHAVREGQLTANKDVKVAQQPLIRCTALCGPPGLYGKLRIDCGLRGVAKTSIAMDPAVIPRSAVSKCLMS